MVETIGRDEFITNRWDYKPGEHVTFIGYTQSGKTTLAFQLLNVTASKELQGVVLVMKPRDRVMKGLIRTLKFRRVRTWPPADANSWTPPKLRPRGWVLWPKLGDIRRDNQILRHQFGLALAESYTSGANWRGGRAPGRIVFADEVTGIAKELGLEDELNAIWMRGSGMDVGLWAATQRPFNAPLFAYNAATHLFLHHDTDRRNTDRYRDIGGGFNGDRIREITTSELKEHQFLYLRKAPKRMCIVDLR